MSEFLDTVEFESNPSSNLSNGDEILITPTYNQEIAESNGINVKENEVIVTVSGLGEMIADTSCTDTYDGHLYKIVNEGMTWKEAKEECERMNGHLVIVTSQEEEKFIENLIEEYKGHDTYHYWLGATDEDKEGVWKWVNGKKFWKGGSRDEGGHSVDGMYENWLPSQPNNSTKESSAGHDYLEIQVTNGNEANEYMTWTDLPNDGIAWDYEEAPDYNNTKYYGYICEWGN